MIYILHIICCVDRIAIHPLNLRVKHVSRGRRVGLYDLIDIFDEASEKRRALFLFGLDRRRRVEHTVKHRNV